MIRVKSRYRPKGVSLTLRWVTRRRRPATKVWGKETQSATPTWPFASRPTRHQTAQMLWSIRYRLLCWLLRMLVRCDLDELDLETVVLQHQLKVLRRGGRRVPLHHGGSGVPRSGGSGPVPAPVQGLPGRPGHAREMAPGPPEERRRTWLAAARSSSARSLDQAP